MVYDSILIFRRGFCLGVGNYGYCCCCHTYRSQWHVNVNIETDREISAVQAVKTHSNKDRYDQLHTGHG